MPELTNKLVQLDVSYSVFHTVSEWRTTWNPHQKDTLTDVPRKEVACPLTRPDASYRAISRFPSKMPTSLTTGFLSKQHPVSLLS
jgi:hypothetical protein